MDSQQLQTVPVAIGGNNVQTVMLGQGTLGLICGPCVIESRDSVLRHAERIHSITQRLGLPLIFKASYDKANRTSASGYRGVGIDEGLEILSEVRSTFALPVITDIHAETEVAVAASVADVLQIPAFLCRQTSLLSAAGRSGKPVLIKKGQFLAPQDMRHAVQKVRATGNEQVLVCERGSCFGYRELIVDFRGLSIMAASGAPVVFDGTHAVQVMGGGGDSSGGDRRHVAGLVRAAVAVGIDALFLEAHEDPDHAPSDGPNMLPLPQLEALLRDVKRLHELSLETR